MVIVSTNLLRIFFLIFVILIAISVALLIATLFIKKERKRRIIMICLSATILLSFLLGPTIKLILQPSNNQLLPKTTIRGNEEYIKNIEVYICNGGIAGDSERREIDFTKGIYKHKYTDVAKWNYQTYILECLALITDDVEQQIVDGLKSNGCFEQPEYGESEIDIEGVGWNISVSCSDGSEYIYRYHGSWYGVTDWVEIFDAYVYDHH